MLIIVTVLATACGYKNQALTEAEAFGNTTSKNENVLRYAPAELQRAEQTLQQASQAETSGDMTSLAYVANPNPDRSGDRRTQSS